ncbi:MAG: polyribonucleotide nucleotidyltransferase [Sphingomonadales bacterium]|nr:polyribonucleotide nucleotidyltransferase [Sphingomonadales bacterium]
MLNIQKTQFDTGDGKIIEIETGRLARQAHGSCVLKVGKTMILATVVSNYDAREGIDFLPLSVDYQEKFAAVGRIPGSFHRREAKLTDYEVLISRLVDRCLRPLFPEDYHGDTQVNLFLISSDENILPDTYVGLAASTALMLTDIPFQGPISEVRVGRIDGKFVINPTKEELEKSDIDMLVGGTAHDINMVEGEMDEVSEADFLEALKFGHNAIKHQCAEQIKFVEMLGGRKQAREYNHETNDEELRKQVIADCSAELRKVAESGSAKSDRHEAFRAILDQYLTRFEGAEDADLKKSLVKKYFHEAEYHVMRDMILETGRRLDGRSSTQIRPINCVVDYLPAAHGSSVFTRGETQSLTSVTLGSKMDEQLLDAPMLYGYSRFMLHYNFPGFSTGEVRPNRGPGRREIGHGNLALRGIKKMVPNDVPYVLRIVSDILESNGSSSMATVCAGSMALMDAGIPIKKAVSGIAMGLISKEGSDKYAILSDILGDEDHLGDMDFKVVGTTEGITACQMDIKINGLKWDMVYQALQQAREGRLHILGEMGKAITAPRAEMKPHAPRLEVIEIEKEYIGAVIGPGGKVVQDIQAKSGAKVAIEERDGKGFVEIFSSNGEAMRIASGMVRAIVAVPEVGETYHGTVKNIMDFGAFVEFMPGKDGLLHISEITWERLGSMEGVLKEGDKLDVKLIEIDKKTGKFRLSRKVLLSKPEGYVEPAPRERREGGGDRGPRREHRDDRGPRRDS